MGKNSADNLPHHHAPIPHSFFEYVKSFGPGFIIVLTWLGSGDIISAGISGGNYGYALMWAMVFAVLMRFFFVTTIAKYQLCNPHGDGVLDGLVRLHPWYAPFLLLMVFIIGHINGTYMLAGIGETMIAMTGFGSKELWAVFWIIISLMICFQPLYATVEKIFKFFMVVMTISLVGAAIWVGPNLIGILKGTFALKTPSQQGPFSAMIVAMAMVGSVGGSLMNLVYPYFLEQKGWRAPQYRKVQTYDFILAITAMIIFNLSVWTLGAELVHDSGKPIANLSDMTALLSIILGKWGRQLFFLGMFSAVYTSILGNSLGLGYLGSHAFQRWRVRALQPVMVDYRQQPTYRIIAVWILVSPLGWIFSGKADFVSLTLLANTLMVVLIPALAGGLWWITANRRYVGEKYKNRWWENLLMGFLFILALYGTLESIKSVVVMVRNLF